MKINLSKTNEYGEGPECRVFHDERVSRGHFDAGAKIMGCPT